MANLFGLTSMGRKRLTLSQPSPANQLAAPVANAPTTATTGGSGGAFQTVYFRLTALDANGFETTASNEVSVATGAGSTNTATVTFSGGGAGGTKVYRSITFQGNEKLVATLGTGVTTYTDTLAGTGTAPVPQVNATGLTVVNTGPSTGRQWRKLLITANNQSGSRQQFWVRVAGAEWVAYNVDVLGYDSTEIAFDHAIEAGETIEALVSSSQVRLVISVEELA